MRFGLYGLYHSWSESGIVVKFPLANGLDSNKSVKNLYGEGLEFRSLRNYITLGRLTGGPTTYYIVCRSIAVLE